MRSERIYGSFLGPGQIHIDETDLKPVADWQQSTETCAEFALIQPVPMGEALPSVDLIVEKERRSGVDRSEWRCGVAVVEGAATALPPFLVFKTRDSRTGIGKRNCIRIARIRDVDQSHPFEICRDPEGLQLVVGSLP